MKNKNTIKYLLFAVTLGFSLQAFGVQAAAVTKEEIIDLANVERKKLNLNPLVESELLDKAAFLKAQDMIGNNYFAHTSPSGVDPWRWFDEVGYTYKYAGENLAMDFSNAESVYRAWMRSKSHKENIISDKFQEIGVAVLSGVMDGKETQVAVQLFGTRLSGQELNFGKEVEKIKGEFGNSIEIKEVSINPWQGNIEDEMLVFARVEGNPQKVEAVIKDIPYNLEKLRDDTYMNLITLKDIDLQKDQIIIKAMKNEQNSIFYQVPQESYIGYLAKKEEGEDKSEPNPLAILGPTNSGGGISQALQPFNQNNLLVIIMGVFLVTIANVWILEKEEEKLLGSAKAS